MKMRRNWKSKQTFTLFEIIVAMLILGLIAAGVGWHITRLIGHHRFQSEAADICLALQEAQFIAVIHQTDCELIFDQKDGKMRYQLKTDEPLSILNQKPKGLDQSRFITVNNAKTQQITFKILSSGRIEPTAILGLHQQDPIESQLQGIWLDLQTPIQIKLLHEKPQRLIAPLPSNVEKTTKDFSSNP